MKYFSQKDFSSAKPYCNMDDMDLDTLTMLDYAREVSGIPYIINSAYRTKEHERGMGRDGTSTHTTGKAVDIRAITSRERFLILKGLIEAGFTRIGINKTFIHADTDKDKPSELVWLY
jgi:hypothetical protein